MKEGNPYNADYPQFFLNRVKEDGYLDNLLETRWDQSIDEKTATVDVSLYFRGGTIPKSRSARRKSGSNNSRGKAHRSIRALLTQTNRAASRTSSSKRSMS